VIGESWPAFETLAIHNSLITIHIFKKTRPGGLEPPTVGLEIRCSIRLSYGRSTQCTESITGAGYCKLVCLAAQILCAANTDRERRAHPEIRAG
jgi:hypothetical protein